MSAATALVPSGSVADPSLFILERASAEFFDLGDWLLCEETLRLPLDEVERQQERRAREAQRLLLQAHILARGDGHVGPALRVAQGACVRLFAHRREQTRHVRTVFGEVKVSRLGYGAERAGSIHPLDEGLALAARSFSYEVQRRLVKAAVQGPFEEAVERVEESTGVAVPKRSAEQILPDAARDVDAFYEQRVVPPPEETGSIVVGAVDGKGIPMVKPETALRTVRRGKGEKANKKRMATVAAVFTMKPRVRTPEDVVESLFRTGPRSGDEGEARQAREGPEHKRVWASVQKSQDDVIGEAAAEMARRDPHGQKRHAVVTDGARALQKGIETRIPGALLILDLLHAMGYLWKAAYAFHAEGSAEAVEWVKERALRILRGEVSQVVKGLRQSVTKRGLRGPRRATVLKAAAYLYDNRSRMRYHEYLAAGLPIASGAVEGACRNLIKDRMERSGMRWTIEEAEAMVRLRATYVSGDFEEYWQFHVRQDQARLHPAGRWKAVVAK
jgi:hypothetical protein